MSVGPRSDPGSDSTGSHYCAQICSLIVGSPAILVICKLFHRAQVFLQILQSLPEMAIDPEPLDLARDRLEVDRTEQGTGSKYRASNRTELQLLEHRTEPSQPSYTIEPRRTFNLNARCSVKRLDLAQSF